MRIALGLLAVLVVAAATVTVWYWEPWADDDVERLEPETEKLSVPSADYAGSACRELAGVAARLAERGDAPIVFLRDLGKRAAGIREGTRAFADLAGGGRNVIPGRGFLPRFDDGTAGQVRHFAGIAVATSYGGAATTRLISIFARNDPENSPDGRLTDEGIAFATVVLNGQLALELTPRWLLDHLCRRKPS